MQNRLLIPLPLFLALLCGIGWNFSACSPGGTQPETRMPAQVDFNLHIKPLLSDRCFACHGPDDKARKGNLRLDTEAGAFAALDSLGKHFAIVPGDVEKSLLVQRILSTDPEQQMPPPESNLSLSEYEIGLLTRWIGQGATWKPHWAFLPPQKSELPKVRNKAWPHNEIDHFTLARMEQEGLKPEGPAPREKWLRRASFDLTGLPPSPEEIDAFLQDKGENAWETVVDRLLASPAYGERMASIWLDAARYADSHGYQDDRPRTMWPWRDWVIRAYQHNMPYDSFVVWQLAGDLLPNAGYEHRLATGFNRNHAITQEGGVVNEEYITEYVADRTNTVSAAFLGLTMECARCHDHKYDPISQKDYYSLFAFFNGIEERGQINYFDEAPVPNMRVEDPELEAMIGFVQTQIDSLEATAARIEATPGADFSRWLAAGLNREKLEKELQKGLQGHFRLDQASELKTPNEHDLGRPARMNTGLLEELFPPPLVEGHTGKALQFDGQNFLNLGDIADANWYQPFSLGAWISPPPRSEKDAGLLVRRNEEQKRGGYELALTRTGNLRMSLIHNHSAEKIRVETTRRVAPEKWTHVLATYDGSGRAAGIRLYLDGALQTLQVLEDGLDRKPLLNGNDLLAGNWATRRQIRDDIHGFSGGKMDEIRVYERALSPLEVALLAGQDPLLAYAGGPGSDRKTIERNLLYPHFLRHQEPQWQALQQALFLQRRNARTIPSVMVMAEMDTPRASFVLMRGAYDAYGEKVEPAPPTSVLPFSEQFPRNRLGLAQWITDPQNPLTARVAINRLWQMLFGQGMVTTPEDFGSQGALPTHPELLDWLAVDFVESGWDVKAMLKKIALSATYRQAAAISPEKLKRDPGNRLLARGPHVRLTAEMIRDQALAASGLLSPKVGGHWVKPYQPDGIWQELANQIGENKYRAGMGDELYRRSLYTYWKRTIPPPTMLTFDASERAVCVVKRQSTSTPLQSLILLNDPQYTEASRMLATRMMQEGGSTVDLRIEYGFLLATSRRPLEKEKAILNDLFAGEYKKFRQQPERAAAYLAIGQAAPNPALDPAELAAWTVVANMLLNLDEARMKS